jgi:lysophospholipase L1-like esterase
MKRFEKTVTNLFIVLSSTVLALLVVEWAARVYLLRFASEESFTRYASITQLEQRMPNKKIFSPHRYLGYSLTPNYSNGKNKHNSLGYRGDEFDLDKPENAFRIVCIGGSTTYTHSIDDYELAYPHQLQQYLREEGFTSVEVINSGVPGWSSWESLINFELRVLDCDPDLIIIYHGINDVHPRIVWPQAAYRGDNSGRRGPNQFGLYMPSVFEHSTVLRYALIGFDIIPPHASFQTVIDRVPDTYHGPEFVKQVAAGTYPSGIFDEISAAEMLRTNKPIFFERNIRNMISIAKETEIDVVLGSFAYSPLFTDQPRVSSEEYIAAFEEHNGIIEKVASESEVSFFDFADRFPEDRMYFTDGRHMTPEGAKLKATLFGEFLIRQALLPPRSNDKEKQ